MTKIGDVVTKQLGAIAHARSIAAAPLKPPTSAEEFMGIPFTRGQRVHDAIANQAGSVLAGTIKHNIVPAAAAAADAASPAFFQLPTRRDDVVITVRLDDGTTVERAPSDLIALPASLIVPLANLEPVK